MSFMGFGPFFPSFLVPVLGALRLIQVPFGETYATHRRQHLVEMLTAEKRRAPASREDFMKAYFVSNAMKGSENRTSPEDTGAILRPTTIATVFLDPSEEEPNISRWFLWNATPKVLPPQSPNSVGLLV